MWNEIKEFRWLRLKVQRVLRTPKGRVTPPLRFYLVVGLAQKKEVIEMAIDLKQYELDRIVNMLKSFGWAVVSSSFQDTKVIVTFEKVVAAE